MRPENVDDILPLSPMQRLMLMHTLSAPVAFALSNQFRYRLSGVLDAERFRRAWQALLQRHQALRTCFLWEGLQEPIQLVRTRVTLPFACVDLSDLPPAERERRLIELQDTDRRRGFDLRRAPLVRLTLVRLSAREHLLFWSRHHLILDRWCVDLLFDELFALYAEDSSASPDPLPAPGTFRSYIEWIQKRDPADAEAYWRGVLNGWARPSLLFAAQVRRSPWTVEGLPRVDEVLDEELLRSLAALAKRNRMSLAAVLQGAVALLVSARTERRDVIFGLTVSGRPPDLSDVESTMGSFINNVPVRVAVDTDVAMLDWLRTIHASQAGRFAYEYVSPVDIQRLSGVTAGTPMFDLLALLDSPAVETRSGPGFDVEQLDGTMDSAYPLTLSLAKTLGELRLTGVYDPACVSRETAREILVDLRGVLTRMVAEPASLVRDLLPGAGAPARCVGDAPPRPAAAPRDPRRRAASSRTVPLEGTAAALGKIWCEALGVEHVGLDDDFFALGGSSIQAALAFAEMERQLGRTLPLSTLFKAGSIREILAVMQQPSERTSLVIEIQPHGTRPQLFVVPGIGGNVVGLAEMARAFGPDQPFYGLQARGLDGHEAPATSVEEVATQFIAEMTPVREEPYVLFGICWGALVVFDMARQLSEAGTPPALVILMDPTEHGAQQRRLRDRIRAPAMLRFAGDRVRLYWREYRALDGPRRSRWWRDKRDLLASMIRHRDPFRGNRSEYNWRRVAEANLEALSRYRPAPYTGTVCVLMTAEREIDNETDPRLEWLRYTPQGTPVTCVPGSSTGDAVSGSNIGVLVARVREAVDTVLASGG